MVGKKGLLCVLVASLCLLGGCGTVQNTSEKQSQKKVSTESAKRVEAITEIQKQLNNTVGINETLSDSSRNQMLSKLIADVKAEKLDGRQTYYGLRKVIAAIGCAHCDLLFDGVNPYKQYILPVGFTWMGKELIINRTDEANKKYLGMQVTGINGVSNMELIDKFATIYPYETVAGKKACLEDFYLFASDLMYLGVMKSGDKAVNLQAESSDGKKQEITVPVCKCSELTKEYGLESMERAPKNLPLAYQVQLDSNNAAYAYRADSKNHTMYFQYLYCEEMQEKPMNKFFKEMIGKMKKKDATYKRLVIDVRWNGGGDRMLLQKQLEKYRSYLDSKKIAIIIGENTYSAAAQAVEDVLTLFKQVTIYGGPSGQAIHNYTEIAQHPIKNLKMTLTTPTTLDVLPKLKEKYGDVRKSISPDVEVYQEFSDFQKGVDTVYDTIVEQKTDQAKESVRIDQQRYHIGDHLSAFLKNYEIDYKHSDVIVKKEKTMPANLEDDVAVALKSGDDTSGITVVVNNGTKKDIAWGDAVVSVISIDTTGITKIPDVTIEKKIQWGISPDEAKKVYGKPETVDETDEIIWRNPSKIKKSISMRFTEKKKLHAVVIF